MQKDSFVVQLDLTKEEQESFLAECRINATNPTIVNGVSLSDVYESLRQQMRKQRACFAATSTEE